MWGGTPTFANSVRSALVIRGHVSASHRGHEHPYRLARLGSICCNFEPLPMDAVAASYGAMAAATHRAGRKASARSQDLMIAATAHAYGARLVTANVEDMRHFDGLIEIVAGSRQWLVSMWARGCTPDPAGGCTSGCRNVVLLRALAGQST